MNIGDYSGMSPNKLLKTLDLWSVPVNLDLICKKLGVETQISTGWDKSHSGEITVDNNRKIHIWINGFDAPNRQRFTLAHEIAHLINDVIPDLDKIGVNDSFKDGEFTLNRDGRQDPVEYRANDYAARLLMPEPLIIEHGKQLIKKLKHMLDVDKVPLNKFISAMAAEFKVSEQAMEIRLQNLDLI
ncbi:ImmA/IrrE family metallo-endopeptidase [Vibrio cholerae]|uniref:ImmA/IrrE family metallo-endopeptidase n=1 Tax=Vibrio cholerae TaxID=666 RepID=UPI0018F0A43F|nr:ImmA/IrrE family metallo-endopeptidase [Vibrio cholerae]MBJ6932841.1 ImmA/IrrE family metallo-endopeptidase [Vibrio cholerae]HDL9480097.1 ImmA/IrrE family metallo-endopeptidase [Vibrio cholerae]